MRAETTNDGKSGCETVQRRATANVAGNEPNKLRSRRIGRQADSPTAPNYDTKSLSLIQNLNINKGESPLMNETQTQLMEPMMALVFRVLSSHFSPIEPTRPNNPPPPQYVDLTIGDEPAHIIKLN